MGAASNHWFDRVLTLIRLHRFGHLAPLKRAPILLPSSRPGRSPARSTVIFGLIVLLLLFLLLLTIIAITETLSIIIIIIIPIVTPARSASRETALKFLARGRAVQRAVRGGQSTQKANIDLGDFWTFQPEQV